MKVSTIHRILAGALILAAASTSLRAQRLLSEDLAAAETTKEKKEDTLQLEEYTVSATRSKQLVANVPNSVTVLSIPELQRSQIPDLRTALELSPGVNVLPSGAIGGTTSIFVRGANSKHTLIYVDGIRMSATDQAADSYNAWLGSAGLNGLGRVEVLRGAQGTLYGNNAMGGIISVETARGEGSLKGLLSLSAGSFNTYAGSVSVAGSVKDFSYSFSLGGITTSNDRGNNDLDQHNLSTRLEYAVFDALSLGITYRQSNANYDEPGDIYNYPAEGGRMKRDSYLLTAYADINPVENFNSRLTYGWVQGIYSWNNIPYSAWGAYNQYRTTRNIIDWQNTWMPMDKLQLVAGLNMEWADYVSTFKSDDRLRSAYINVIYRPIKNLELVLGGRDDYYDTVGNNATWHAGVSYRIEESGTRLRATYGTGFNVPVPEYVQGGPWYTPNPDLKPEKAQSWDIGIDQDLMSKKISLGATYFQNKFKDMFLYSSGQMINVSRASTKGVELSLLAHATDKLSIRTAYTYLHTEDKSTGQRLSRRPRHTLNVDTNYKILADPEWIVGMGASLTGSRPDSYYDGTIWSNVNLRMGSATTFRIYTSYQVTSFLTLKLRVENLFDKDYQPVAGYPALPRGFFGSIDWRF